MWRAVNGQNVLAPVRHKLSSFRWSIIGANLKIRGPSEVGLTGRVALSGCHRREQRCRMTVSSAVDREVWTYSCLSKQNWKELMIPGDCSEEWPRIRRSFWNLHLHLKFTHIGVPDLQGFSPPCRKAENNERSPRTRPLPSVDFNVDWIEFQIPSRSTEACTVIEPGQQYAGGTTRASWHKGHSSCWPGLFLRSRYSLSCHALSLPSWTFFNMRILCVCKHDSDVNYANAEIMAVEQRRHPELKGKPTAVVQYKPFRGGAIIAVGYEARHAGVTRFVI